MSEADWQRVMAEHRPGGVVRVQAPSPARLGRRGDPSLAHASSFPQAPSPTAWGDRPLEQPYALANDRESGVVSDLEVAALLL